MRDLYTAADLEAIQGQLRKRYLAMGAVSLLFIGIIVFSMIRRMEWLTVVAVALWGSALIFLYDLFCKPLLSYRKLLNAAMNGRSHTETLEYARRETEESMIDGVRCVGLVFLGQPDKHGSREQLLYWDREKDLPGLQAGETREIKYTGKIIIGFGT